MSPRRGRSGRHGAKLLGEEMRARVAGLVAKGAGGACLEGEGLLLCLAGERAGCGWPGPGGSGLQSGGLPVERAGGADRRPCAAEGRGPAPDTFSLKCRDVGKGGVRAV